MKVQRVISWFDKKTEILVSEKNIDAIELKVLKEIFAPSIRDELMYNPYEITEKEAIQLNKFVELNFDFDLYCYQLDCFQV